MEDPSREIKQIILQLTENDDPVLHKATVDKYFLPTASFQHPLCNVLSGPSSRETIKRVYAVYKFFTSNVKIDFIDVTINKPQSRIVIELEESLSPSFVPFDLVRFHNVKIITILDLQRDMGGDGRYWIAKQYDVFPIDELSNIVPFGFLYGWWKGLATLTGSVVGGGLQMTGLW